MGSLHIPERTLRRTGAWLLLCSLLQGELGLAWDIRWHLSIHTGVIETFVPWATRLLVPQMGLRYRPGQVPSMNRMNLLLSLLFVLTALVIDGFTHKQTLSTATTRSMLLLAIGIAILAITVPMGIALVLAQTTVLTPDIATRLESHALDLLFLLPVVISVATVGAIWGKHMGNFWNGIHDRRAGLMGAVQSTQKDR